MSVSYKQNIMLESHFPFEIFDQRLSKGFNMGKKFHWHECLEISYVKSGKGRYYFKDRAYDMIEGDIIAISNVEPHYLEVFQEMHQKVIVFEPSLITSELGMAYDYHYLNPFYGRGTNFNNKLDRKNSLYSKIVQTIVGIEKEYNSKQAGYTLIIRAKLLTVLTYLIRYFRKNGMGIHNHKLGMARVGEVMEYVKENFSNTITLEHVAKRVNLSPQYFSTMFKNVTGMNYIEYLNKIRIDHAVSLLLETDMKMTQIAMECGYNNTVNFNIAFRKYTGKTPSAFKKDKQSCGF